MDEAQAARARVENEDDFDFDAEDDPFLDDDDGAPPPLDRDSILWVRYERGFINTVDDLRTEAGHRATEWTSPRIPRELLDCLLREAIDELEGPWGDPDAAHPIQVDALEVDTGDTIFLVEVFNRAKLEVQETSGDAARLHRTFAALERAEDQGRDVTGLEGPVAPEDCLWEYGPTLDRDPVIDAYKRDIDRSLLREQLKKTSAERVQDLVNLAGFADELKRAGSAAKSR
jgi:hypothetical protein